MKIAIVTHYFLPKYLAGTEMATLNIARCLVKKGHKVHIITWLDEGLPKHSMQDGIHVHRVFGKNIRFFSHILYWTKIFMALREINPNIAHIQNINLGVPGFLSKKFLKIPYLIYERGFDNLNPHSFIRKIILKLGLKNADIVLVLTEEMKKELTTIYEKEILVVPNGIDFDRFHNGSKYQRKTFNKKTIIFVGRLEPVKGVEYLIKAMEILRNKDENISLIIIGDGSQREILENLVKNLNLEKRITFKGEIPNDNIPKFLHQADVFVLPSISEGFPNVILEAMAAGLPIVSTNVNGLSEIIINNENGYLVEPGNPDKLAQKVFELLKNQDMYKTMSENNIKKAKTFSWESVVCILESIYTNILTTYTGGK